MQNLQEQKDEDWAHQEMLLCIVPSYDYHINGEAFEKGSQQSICSLCKSGITTDELHKQN